VMAISYLQNRSIRVKRKILLYTEKYVENLNDAIFDFGVRRDQLVGGVPARPMSDIVLPVAERCVDESFRDEREPIMELCVAH